MRCVNLLASRERRYPRRAARPDVDGRRFDYNRGRPNSWGRHRAANIAGLWDIHTDDLIASRSYRRVHYGEA